MKTHSGNILIAAPVHQVLVTGLADLGYHCIISEQITQTSAFDLVADCVGIITSTRLQLNKELIDAAPQLQWIGRMGSGMEVIDVPYASSRNINCFSSPEGNCNAVGEHALGMLLNLIRRMAWSQAEVKNGIWLREENRGIELEDKTVGIIGYGHTGQAFAKKLRGFDTNVLVYDKYNAEAIPTHLEKCDTLEPLFRDADIISFHVPLQPDTTHYLNDAFVHNMHKPFIVVNTSRGIVVDTAALQRGMVSGKILGACLDVLEREPLSAMDEAMHRMLNEMMTLPNIVVTPHIAGYTHEALYKMSKVLLEKINKMF